MRKRKERQRSPSTVHVHLKPLRETGYLERTGQKPCTLSLTETVASAVYMPILRRVTAGNGSSTAAACRAYPL